MGSEMCIRDRTLGILWPVAFVWAYHKPRQMGASSPTDERDREEESLTVLELKNRIEALESALRATSNQSGGSDS